MIRVFDCETDHGDGSTMRKAMPLLTIAALSVLLSACFVSEGPKFPASSAVPFFGEGGRYAVLEHAGDGKFERQRVVTVKPMPDGTYVFVGDKTRLPISFHEVGNGVVVAQAKPHEKRNAYGYLIATRNDQEVSLHLPQCEKQDPKLLSEHGVVRRDKYECSIDKVSDPAKLFAAVTPGPPTSKMVPE
jgi:hypothetical protein